MNNFKCPTCQANINVDDPLNGSSFNHLCKNCNNWCNVKFLSDRTHALLEKATGKTQPKVSAVPFGDINDFPKRDTFPQKRFFDFKKMKDFNFSDIYFYTRGIEEIEGYDTTIDEYTKKYYFVFVSRENFCVQVEARQWLMWIISHPVEVFKILVKA
jgi:hypothetical protein